MKRILVIVLILMSSLLQAQGRIGREEAYATAEQFLHNNREGQKLTSCEVMDNLYVFSIEPQGFVIVSAMNELLAYSFESNLQTNALPAPVAYWLELYHKRTDYLAEHPEQIRQPLATHQAVEPLLTSKWGQGCYYNNSCPYDIDGPCRHVLTGCVATAMAQIMYYHKQPRQGNNSLSYICAPYGTLTAHFGQTAYHWEEMTDQLDEQNTAVAQLMSHCGIAVKMSYSPQVSAGSSFNALSAFRQYFLYPSAIHSSRRIFSDEEWTHLIKDDLDAHLPVYYAGYQGNMENGHAFVCDGYDEAGLFHFNFGWDGGGNGYFTLDDPCGFSMYQSVIHHLCPIASLPIQSDSHGTIYVAPDGTGNGSSWEQATSDLQLAAYKAYFDHLTIWVKEGTYYGNPDEKYAFTLPSGCMIYGGFTGNEPYDFDLSQRDVEAHPTILDGNGSQGVIHIPSYFTGRPAVIDGFTIQNGNAFSGILIDNNAHLKRCKICHNTSNSNGGGIKINSSGNPLDILVEDCELFENEAKSGGAISDHGNVTYLRCRIHDNAAIANGGGVHCATGAQQSHFINCEISHNTAKQGGGIACNNALVTFWSCLVNNNTATTGGGCYLQGGGNLYNCTIVKNEAEEAFGGVYHSSTRAQSLIKNCIIWGNISQDGNLQIGPDANYSYCAVQNDQSLSELNINAMEDNDGNAPACYIRFKDADVIAGYLGHGGDWRLQSNSLCIDRGTPIAHQPEYDLEGNPRQKHRNIDLGAYESNSVSYLIDAYYCEQDPYYYQDSLLSGLGTYSFLYPGNNYDSLVIVQMKPIPPTVFLKETICDHDIYDFFGTPLDEPGIYHATINCVTYELDLDLKPLGVVTLVEEICENETYDFHGTLLHEPGHYATTVDCITYELDLTVNTMAVVTKAAEICEGETYRFFNRQLSQSGQYYDYQDCKEHQLYLTVHPLPELQCCRDTLVSLGQPLVLKVSGAESYQWSTGDTTDCITVIPNEDMVLLVTGKSENGCDRMARINVQIDKSTEEVILYPNPANDKVKVYMPLIDEVEVFTLLGERIERIPSGHKTVDLDVSDYPNGVYLVHVKQFNKHNYSRLLICH